VFAELLVLDHLGARHEALRAVTAAQLMDFTARTVFRQAMITQFEATAYAARADGDLLTAQRLTELWLDARRWLHGDTPMATDDVGWALVPHFIHHRFYNYAYALAALTATSLLGQWHAEPERFPARYLAFLSQGGAVRVADQLARLGVDGANSWDAALDGLQTALHAAVPSARAH
jgi:oligoendopeptidase F